MFHPAIERALTVAVGAHQGQYRKGGEAVPYAVHPLHVAMMLARAGYEDPVIQAALLHDVVEDCPEWTLARVEREFDAHVAAIVAELTEDKSQPWQVRKQRAVDQAPHLSPEAAAVRGADKLHNLRTLADALRASPDPDPVWAKFKGGREETLRTYRALVAALAPRLDARLARALGGALADLEEAASARATARV
jgi:(p)ppGpp synthase/HD superfamily hydrolase